MPWRSTELVVGHRYLNQHSLLEDSSQLDLRILQRFSEAWAFSGKWRFSLLDGKLDIQEYNVYHNMGSWYLGVGAFVRKNGNKNEFGLGISFTIQQTGDYMPVKSFDIRKGHGFLRGFSRKLFPFSEDSRFENGVCPVWGVVPERERYVAGQQEAESLRLEGWRAACFRRAGQEERKKG